MKEIQNIIGKKNRIYRIFLISISILLNAVVYNLFLLPLNLVTGGTSGIATITHYAYGMNPALVIFIISAACSIIGFMYLGKEKTIGTLITCIAYPALVQLTMNINKVITFDTSDVILVVLFSSVLSGVANGLMYRSGYSNGGLPLISQVMLEKLRIPIARSSLIMNVIIVLAGAFFFGSTNALYAILYLYINNLVMDRVLLGISNNKAFYIITEKEMDVKEYIINNLHHTVTTFPVKGGFLEDKKKVILTVIPTREYYKLTEGIKEIDEDVFFVATDSYQVEGAK